jgi:hypothetical protein
MPDIRADEAGAALLLRQTCKVEACRFEHSCGKIDPHHAAMRAACHC